VTVLVVGGGFAGVAAAWALERRGQEVMLVWDGPGASGLYSGALDRSEWHGPLDPRPLSRDAEAFLAELGCFAPVTGPLARLATTAGLLRPARGRDRAVLDCELLRGRRIDVVDLSRPGWDAEQLAQAWSASGWARSSRTEFRPVSITPPAAVEVRGLGDRDLAACFDEPSYAAAFAQVLQQASDGESPLLLGPWLGLVPSSVDRVRQLARRPLGETLSDPGGAAGWRFEVARDAWLERSRVEAFKGEVVSVQRADSGFEVLGRLGSPGEDRALDAEFSHVILALGGVVGGGVLFSGGAGGLGRSFSLSVRAPVALRLGGHEVALQSGALGADLQSLGLETLTEVGLAVDEQYVAQGPDLYAVGDVVADRPRTALEAISAGIAAARAVCRVRASESP
jgi:glycerol-3-phosphate dehydrogenase subunit B